MYKLFKVFFFGGEISLLTYYKSFTVGHLMAFADCLRLSMCWSMEMNAEALFWPGHLQTQPFFALMQ